ncbi:molybdenum cofactor biosynthesis protein MoaE [Paenibacillus donghaensis]|uniref:Molybdopterin converting factor n=1 Tax=Paenibacillus donghaensis TaxID=414771 RepID=A0A2Z2KB03_9BACL|nr:molybdenum cofactor biosynthesis protein MoaE [Paenibacillus donghaensis]ASA20130.1 molybdopterin converting factor [Paenibacillus donghaensis]
MQLTIRLFAGLAEVMGASALPFHADDRAPLTAGRLKELLSAAYPAAASQIKVSLVAVDHEYAPEDTVITAAAEVALIPPVSGGEPAVVEATPDGLYSITELPLNAEALLEQVLDVNHGASLLFVGTTREMTGQQRTTALQYEAYVPMALSKLQTIGHEVRERWNASCAIAHRIGVVGLKEASVVIAVSAPHRDTCYEASRYAIEQLKQTVPVWKKDIGESSAEWGVSEQIIPLA